MECMLYLELSVFVLIPLISPFRLNDQKVADYSEELAKRGKLAPISCFEQGGYILILDGHHRWAAYLASKKFWKVPIEVLSAERLSQVTIYKAETILHEVSWKSVYDWEAAFNIRLPNDLLSPKTGNAPLTIISGPSGVGKSTILDSLKAHGIRLADLRTTTTRQRRNYETNGVHYDFVSKHEFDELITRGSFAEWQNVHGNFYGSRWELLFPNATDALRIKDLDVIGALQLKTLYPNAVQTIFVQPSDTRQLDIRLKSRGSEDKKTRLMRLTRAHSELCLSALFDHVIVNDEISRTAEQLLHISNRPIHSNKPKLFSTDSSVHGTYVQLIIHDDSGRTLVWKNIRESINPTLMVPTGVPLSTGFRLLEQLVIERSQTNNLRTRQSFTSGQTTGASKPSLNNSLQTD
jgi:guanylate kinase